MELFLDQKLVRKDQMPVDIPEALRNKIVGVYFSASWSPPCRSFTPDLNKFYEEVVLKKKGPFEIVYLPCDKTQEEMEEYVTSLHGNWLAMEFNDPLISTMREKFKVDVVPKLIIVKPNGDIISSKGRREITDKGVIAFRTWFDSADLDGITSSKLFSESTESRIHVESEGKDKLDMNPDEKLPNIDEEIQ